jgi:hypothetical protein
MFAPSEMVYGSGGVANRWEFHDFQLRETFDNAGIEQGESIAQFIANSQAYQANLVQFATEAYRRAAQPRSAPRRVRRAGRTARRAGARAGAERVRLRH